MASSSSARRRAGARGGRRRGLVLALCCAVVALAAPLGVRRAHAAETATAGAGATSPPRPATTKPTASAAREVLLRPLSSTAATPVDPAVDALRRGGPEALGIGLSITAALISFHVGVLSVLEKLGVVDLARSPIAGGSGGSVVAFSVCVGLSVEETAGLVEDLSLYCSTRDSCAGVMGAPVRAAVKQALALAVAKARREGWPEAAGAASTTTPPSDAEVGDALVRNRCRGRVQFAVSELTRGLPRRERAEQQNGAAGDEQGAASTTNTPAAPPTAKTADPAAVLAHPSIPLAQASAALPWRPWLVGDYTGADEAVDAASASAFISYFSGGSNALPFRGRRVADALFTVPLPCPVSPAVAVADPYDRSPLATDAALQSAPSASATPILHCLRISAALPDTPLLPGTPALAAPHIAPFLRVPELAGGVSTRAWQRRALLAGDRAASRALAKLGEMEAEAWAVEVGLLEPSAAVASTAAANRAVVTAGLPLPTARRLGPVEPQVQRPVAVATPKPAARSG